MLSRFRELLNKFDDEKFLVDISKPAGRNKKIIQLRRARSVQFLSFIFLLFTMIPVAHLFPKGDLGMMFGLVLLCLISFGATDSQIKMLLLSNKSQRE